MTWIIPLPRRTLVFAAAGRFPDPAKPVSHTTTNVDEVTIMRAISGGSARHAQTCRLLAVAFSLIFANLSIAKAQDANRTVMAIFAHPDDEVFVSPILSRYAREGHDVYLVVATDGAQGVREHAGIPAGEALARARAEETRCAADRLGIHPPILLGHADGGLADFAALANLRNDVVRLLREHRPAAVITFGPDGGTGHPDHRLVGNTVTEIVQSSGDGPLLYYVSVPAERLQGIAGPAAIRGTAERYLPVRVPFEPRDRDAARESFACHASQFTAEEQAEIFGLLDHVLEGRIYLRSWRESGEPRAHLLP